MAKVIKVRLSPLLKLCVWELTLWLSDPSKIISLAKASCMGADSLAKVIKVRLSPLLKLCVWELTH